MFITKCPKCKFVFDVEGQASDHQEITTACPRCGMPFTITTDNYITDYDKSAENVDEQKIEETQTESENTISEDNQIALDSQDTNHTHQWSIPLKEIAKDIAKEKKRPPKFKQVIETEKSKLKKGSCSWRLLFFVFFLLLITAMTIRTCNKPVTQYKKVSSFIDKDIEDSDDSNDESVINNQTDYYTYVISQPKRVKKPMKTPDWINGKWQAKTDYGTIMLYIRKDTITESVGNECVTGTFVYESGCINCNFGDGDRFIYPVDEENKTIYPAKNLPMKKI